MIDWTELIPEAEWKLYRPVLQQAQERGLQFAVGGGMAFSGLSGRLRNTKDLDLFVPPAQRELAADIVRSCGYTDYYALEPYDRGWIYRGYKAPVILDIIWQMANYRAAVDEQWVTRGPLVDVYGMKLRLLPPEELVWAKMYVVQRGRCDWPDLMSVLHARASSMDWEHLMRRVGTDLALLASVVQLFAWLQPDGARQVPADVRQRLGVLALQPAEDHNRVNLLDSRPWFGPTN
jgi:hypothetical protein